MRCLCLIHGTVPIKYVPLMDLIGVIPVSVERRRAETEGERWAGQAEEQVVVRQHGVPRDHGEGKGE